MPKRSFYAQPITPPPPAGGVGGYNHHDIEVEWRPPLLYANPLGHRVRATPEEDSGSTGTNEGVGGVGFSGVGCAHPLVHLGRGTPLPQPHLPLSWGGGGLHTSTLCPPVWGGDCP